MNKFNIRIFYQSFLDDSRSWLEPAYSVENVKKNTLLLSSISVMTVLVHWMFVMTCQL